jgi:putative ATP-dependent Zn protease
MKIAFDNDLYLKLQSENILKRVNQFGDKLYLEFGGKLFDDYHASRVLPGFLPDSKLKMLLKIKDDVEIIIAISAHDIQKNKIRNDLGINYETEVLRLIDAFRSSGLFVGSVCVTQYQDAPTVNTFIKKLNNLGISVYKHYIIEGYPHCIDKIISEEGFGKNEYIKTSHKIVVVTAPGPGSGKMATCLSQLYHENKNGIKAGYAKYETFPIWNLDLKDPVNVAYEAATADLADVNMIDPYHLNHYGKLTVNYNRDVEIFPVLKSMFTAIYGKCPYESPTDMGVNMAGFAIVDHELASRASKDEIIRRYYQTKVDLRNGKVSESALEKIKLLMQSLNINENERKCVLYAHKKKEESQTESMALEMPDGTIISAKTSNLLLAPSALILNALKYLAKIPDDIPLLSYQIIEPICNLKVNDLGNHNPRLHVNEVLNALAISASTNPLASLAMSKLSMLKGAQAHSTVILSEVDSNLLKKLKVDLTTDDEAYAHKLYVR